MRKCDEHQTLVHLDVHACPVCVCGGGGGGWYSQLYIYNVYMKIPKILKLIDFVPPKMVWAYIWAMTCDFQQYGILAGMDSDEPVQPSFKLRNYNYVRSVA